VSTDRPSLKAEARILLEIMPVFPHPPSEPFNVGRGSRIF
jgi:hypothetical protein